MNEYSVLNNTDENKLLIIEGNCFENCLIQLGKILPKEYGTIMAHARRSKNLMIKKL